jgi:hypothetical protein
MRLHLVDMIIKQGLEVKKLEENFVDAWNTTVSIHSSTQLQSRYKHLVKQWVPKELPPIVADFIVNNRTYHVAPSSLHGLGIFSMDEIIVKYNTVTKYMDYVRPCYNYNDWMWLV